LQAYKDSLVKRNQTRRQFERARLGGRPFLDWLQERLDAKKMPVTNDKIYAIGGVEAETEVEAIRLAYNLWLAVLALAHVVKARRSEPIQQGGAK
jgi:hypothetical protein